MPSQDFAVLLRRTAVALVVCICLVIACYRFIDRPVAFYVHAHQFNQFPVFKWLTDPPPLVQLWSPLVLALILIRRAWGPLARWQHVLFVACLSLIVADEFRTSLGDLCGRYWPETWFNDNPSLIGTGTYGFHPFQSGDDIGSFPSGHAARIVGFLSVYWIAVPRLRWLYALVALPMLVSLIGMNYHFVSDVIAGSVLGGIVGSYAVMLGALERDERTL